MGWKRNNTTRGGKKRKPRAHWLKVTTKTYAPKHTPARAGMPVAWGWNPNGGAFGRGGRHPATVLGCPRPTWMMFQ